VQLLYKKYSKV
jgi:hypothetical protein